MTAQIPKILHLIFLSSWGGIVSAEAVLELLPLWKKEYLKSTVVFHYFIDIILELPVILLVITTGIINLFLVPITSIQIIKVVAACVAIGANLYCIVTVIRRYTGLQAGADGTIIAKGHRKVIISAVVGVPFAMCAVALGFYIALTHAQTH